MKLLDLTFPTPQHNLACDEALIDLCEEGYEEEILRFWEPREHFVVLGYSTRIAADVNTDLCRAYRIPVLRRCSGGGTVLQGPGCLNFSLVLRIRDSGPMKNITEASAFILRTHQRALEPLIGAKVELQGASDLAVGRRKVSGNAQRWKRRFFLFHGTMLLDLDIALVEKLLAEPAQQPAYRQRRSHGDFLTNVRVPPGPVKAALKESWQATDSLDPVPYRRIDHLVAMRYGCDDWNLKF